MIEENAECVAAIQHVRTVAESLGYRTHDTAGSLLPLARPKRVRELLAPEVSFQLYYTQCRISTAAAEATGCEYVVSVRGEAANRETRVIEAVDGGHGW